MSSQYSPIPVMGVAVTSDDGVGLAGQTVSFSSESMDRRVVPLPRWPVSAAQEGFSISTRPLRICPHEETTDANAVIAELLIGNRNPREAFAQLTLPEWFISMHVHGVNDYGRRASDLDYEDRSEVTTFLSDVSTTADLDDPAHYIAYTEGDSSEPVTNFMDGAPESHFESESLEPTGAPGVDTFP